MLWRAVVCCAGRQQGATELDMEALATLMAHSVTEQRRTYDRRTRDQKVGTFEVFRGHTLSWPKSVQGRLVGVVWC